MHNHEEHILKGMLFFSKTVQQKGLLIRLIDEVIKMSTYLSVASEAQYGTLLEIDEEQQTVYINGHGCALTQQEFYLLQELAQRADCIVTREELLRDAWGYKCPGNTRTVDVHVQRLRRKLGIACIETVYRMGYRFHAQVIN